MSFKFHDNLYYYDVFPLVHKVGVPTEINIRSLGGRVQFVPSKTYNLMISGVEGGMAEDFPLTASCVKKTLVCNGEGGFTFTHTFESEQEYVLIFSDEDSSFINSFSVYAVEDDLAERYPFRGDLHIHTTRSDGREIPGVVLANYRRHGYDFMAITDHHRYYPSLEGMEVFKDVPIELNIVPGEEVQLPHIYGVRNDVHMVNFGGEYSVNALIEHFAVAEKGKDLKYRAIRTENVPDVMTMDEYQEKMQSLTDAADVADGVEKLTYATCEWVFDRIRDANGLGIFAHPNWKRRTAYHVPEVFTDYMMEKQPFDAFEVLGGENYYEQNGFQTVRYYEERAKGHRIPIVGSTDSHCSYPSNRNAYICSTVVFAHENERTELIKSIKDFYSVAVDTINEDFRLVGENRLVRYTCFLLKNYFPLHDELCIEDGRLMKQYITGTAEEREEAEKLLRAIYGRVRRHRKKYFGF